MKPGIRAGFLTSSVPPTNKNDMQWRALALNHLFFLLVSNPVPIHTTIADSSLVAFTIDTQVSFDSVLHNSDNFIRFIDIPVTDSIGYPEVPVLL